MSEDEKYDFDPSKIKNEVWTGEEEEDYNEEVQNYEPVKEEDFNYNPNDIVNECYIDNLKEEEDKDIGFDLSLIKRNELYVNLIHFDTNMSNSENYRYYNDFKVDVIGGFQAIDKLDLLERYLEAIKNLKIPFIVISSGSSGKDVIQICQKFSFVKEVIIFCRNYEYNKHYLTEYPKYVKKVLTSKKEVYKYIKSFGSNKSNLSKKKTDQFVFSYDEIKMNNQLEQCPVISAYEYDKCYFLVHRAYAHFFGKMEDKKSLPVFEESRFKKVKDFIEKSKLIDKGEKAKLIKKFESLKESSNFTEKAIELYTGESTFCYIFNRTMRNFEEGLISLAFYMGPFLYGVNKYVYENPEKFAFREDMTLYRNIQCRILDFYLYKLNLKHIICFPSITSTSTVRGKFKPTGTSKKINKTDGISLEDIYRITMVFHYKHQMGNISPGIIVKDNKTKDGKYLSKHKNENEVILFPFTFVRITEIKEIEKEKEKNLIEMHLDIINRKDYIEYTLRDDVENRFLFSKLD